MSLKQKLNQLTMRPIKFRAWNKDAKKMWSWENMEHGKIFALDSKLEHKDFWVIPNGKHLELMQFTGLLDKNSVEIYEGDVLWGHYFVEWLSEGSFNGYYAVRNGNPKHYIALPYYSDLEVIGNVWENKELLK